VQLREKFDQLSSQELACVAWALQRFGHTGSDNPIFYLLEKQASQVDVFRDRDFEILANPKLLCQIISWRGQD